MFPTRSVCDPAPFREREREREREPRGPQVSLSLSRHTHTLEREASVARLPTLKQVPNSQTGLASRKRDANTSMTPERRALVPGRRVLDPRVSPGHGEETRRHGEETAKGARLSRAKRDRRDFEHESVSGSYDKCVSVWDVASGRLDGFTRRVRLFSLTFSSSLFFFFVFLFFFFFFFFFSLKKPLSRAQASSRRTLRRCSTWIGRSAGNARRAKKKQKGKVKRKSENQARGARRVRLVLDGPVHRRLRGAGPGHEARRGPVQRSILFLFFVQTHLCKIKSFTFHIFSM